MGEDRPGEAGQRPGEGEGGQAHADGGDAEGGDVLLALPQGDEHPAEAALADVDHDHDRRHQRRHAQEVHRPLVAEVEEEQRRAVDGPGEEPLEVAGFEQERPHRHGESEGGDGQEQAAYPECRQPDENGEH